MLYLLASFIPSSSSSLCSSLLSIQFLYTRDVKGTSIGRNSIRNSAHRCITMDGVSNATIAANVTHETAG
jgi:hypothetical protein